LPDSVPGGIFRVTGSSSVGTVMRSPTVRRYAEEAGFGRFEVLPIENDFWRFYRMSG
jgi:hypothetical protein